MRLLPSTCYLQMISYLLEQLVARRLVSPTSLQDGDNLFQLGNNWKQAVRLHLVVQNFLLVSHFTPLNPVLQIHWYEFNLSIHLAPLRHGFFAQSSMSRE